MNDDPILALTRHAIDAMQAAVAAQQRWYTLNAAVTAQAVQQILAGGGGEAFLRSVTVSLSALDSSSSSSENA